MGLSALPQQPNSSFSDVFFSIASHFFLSFALSSVFYHFLNTLFLEVLPALLRGLVVPCIGLLRTICNWLYLNHKSPASQDSFKLLSQRHICCQNFTRITSCTYRALVGLWFKYPQSPSLVTFFLCPVSLEQKSQTLISLLPTHAIAMADCSLLASFLPDKRKCCSCDPTQLFINQCPREDCWFASEAMWDLMVILWKSFFLSGKFNFVAVVQFNLIKMLCIKVLYYVV